MKEFVIEKYCKARLFVNENINKHTQAHSTVLLSTTSEEFASKSLAIEVALLNNTCNYARLGIIYEFNKDGLNLVTDIHTGTKEVFDGVSMAKPNDIVLDGIPEEFIPIIVERFQNFFKYKNFIPQGKLIFYGLFAKIGSCSCLYGALTDLLLEFIFSDLDINDDSVLNSCFIRCFSK